MARTMPPLRVPCCQPRCSGKLANGKWEFATSIFTTVSADARVIAHLCQSLHCCAARHTRQPLKVLGSSPMVDAMAYGVRRTPSSRARPVGSLIHNTGKPRTRRRLPCADHHADERVLLLHRIVLGGPCPASALQCQVVGSINPPATRSTQSRSISSTSAPRAGWTASPNCWARSSASLPADDLRGPPRPLTCL